ncbi:MAG: 30S ribosomal protein S12 methylthiotransferase RimO [Clostridia bacterium]|nr:30S ribosomal protein S12 methylthiotransferase RimO [Clostridia bacterium]
MKIGMISLGCDKNRVDSERMLFLLRSAGFELTDDPSEAEVIIINTCAFIESAKKEAIEAVFDAARYKETGKLKKLIVTGCFAQRYPEADFPEVDLFLPIAEEEKIASVVAKEMEVEALSCAGQGRILTTPAHYAYLKIADGCNNRCSYCAIPAIRGKYRSVPKEELLSEAARLREEGVQELILVAQDVTCYGVDLYKKPSLCELLKDLVKIGFWKVRLLYAYPERISDELIDLMATEKGIARYLDIPLQHVDDDILKKMRRPSSGKKINALIKKLRTRVPGIAIRSTFIVGFPSETDEQNEELVRFVEAGNCDYAGFFIYSPEEGTDAFDMKPRILKHVSRKRLLTCERAQSKATVAAQEKYVGKTVEVLYEGIDFDKQLFYGRTEQNAPDVDTKVYFTASYVPEPGRVYKVKITSSDFHLYGEGEEQ